MDILTVYNKYKEATISGRYIALKHIESLFKKHTLGNWEVVGFSVENRPIYKYTIGQGVVKILMWSQMHGNESTTTKAVFDMLNFLQSNTPEANDILKHYTLCILPMLNPDGAEAYTRVNAVQVDLNRDSQDLTQPESLLLKKMYTDFKPDFGFNLHDQRTIFGAGETIYPATVSFLSPSYDSGRNINQVRLKSMEVINRMNKELQQYIPNQVGRFDDGFNLNCIGDTMQYNDIPTILFESGHYQNDYKREETRKYICIALLSALREISNLEVRTSTLEEYLSIPQNSTHFYDVLIRNVEIQQEKIKKIVTFGILYREILVDGDIVFQAYLKDIGDLTQNKGHQEYDVSGEFFEGIPELEQKATFKIGRFQFKNGILKH